MSLATFHSIKNLDLKALFDYATMGIIIADSSGIVIAINPFALGEFGYTESEVIGNKVEMLIPSRFHQRHIVHRKLYSQNPQTRPMGVGKDLFGVKKDGTEFPVEVSLGNYNSNGDQFVIAFISNITVRKKAEAEVEKLNNELEEIVEIRTSDLKEALEKLEKSQQELQKAITFQKALLHNAGAMIVSVDLSGVIQSFNKEAEKELGYSANEIIGKQTPQIFYDPTLIRKRANELSHELGKEISPGMEVFFAKARIGLHNENEWIYIRKDGSIIPVQLTVTSLMNEKDEIIGFMGIAFNISERKKIEQELQQSLAKEKDLNDLKSKFVSMASHEFRTPLSTILSSSYLIEKYITTDDQPKREKHLQRIISSVSLLTDILNDFLSVGKIEEGKVQVRLSDFNGPELVKSTVAEMKGSLRKRQKIHYQHQGGSDVRLDPSMLKHIIINLVSNASKFSPEGSSIDIRTQRRNHHFILSVKDHGIGISEDDQKHLMERFFRGANAGNIQGTGLGLHIVSKYTELLNGKVECKSELEKGTEFVLTFQSKND
jgi:PAS domain S-box-containing protein